MLDACTAARAAHGVADCGRSPRAACQRISTNSAPEPIAPARATAPCATLSRTASPAPGPPVESGPPPTFSPLASAATFGGVWSEKLSGVQRMSIRERDQEERHVCVLEGDRHRGQARPCLLAMRRVQVSIWPHHLAGEQIAHRRASDDLLRR